MDSLFFNVNKGRTIINKSLTSKKLSILFFQKPSKAADIGYFSFGYHVHILTIIRSKRRIHQIS